MAVRPIAAGTRPATCPTCVPAPAAERHPALVIDDDAMMRPLVRETLEGIGPQRAR
ncbi:MAG: hypothetical protein HYU73_26950 [Betaproteobacteria bacterium]|nr:hypothetical protein [Betaproteobacteria bacterium]MBI3055973.1 hypothetical protein [Betaproteobacteria bacterium]